MYIGVQSNPYLILKIDEIPGVYSGTNSHTNNAFAHLCFDKEYKNSNPLNDSSNNAMMRVPGLINNLFVDLILISP